MDRAQRDHRLLLGIGASYVVLALLTSRAGNLLPAVALAYLVPMTASMLRLERPRLAGLAAFALVTHGTALFMLVDHGHRLPLAALWAQFAALGAAFAWSTYQAGAVLRLRARLAQTRRRLHDLGREAEENASRDALTGVFNRHHLMEALEREISRAERIGKPLSVARADLDWLGSVNEALGHAAGDVALKRFTAAARSALRDVDVFGRYGGKEFLIVMPDTGLEGAVIAAERVRAAVGGESLPEVRGRRHLSCTLGVADHRKGENTRLLVGRAEAGLSYAKAAGRDRVVALGADGRPNIVGAA